MQKRPRLSFNPWRPSQPKTKEKISATIAEVESRTAGEVVVALVSQSDDYADVRYPAAFGLTIISAIATGQFASGWLLDYLIPLQLPIFLICFQLTKIPAFTRFSPVQPCPSVAASAPCRCLLSRASTTPETKVGSW